MITFLIRVSRTFGIAQTFTFISQWGVCLICCAVFLSCSTATPLPTLDLEYGFKGLQFETDTLAVIGLVPMRWESVTQDVALPGTPSRTYIRPQDTLTVYGYPVTRIAYTFYKGKLSCIFVTVKGQQTFDHIVEGLQRTYGKGEGTLGLTPSERLWIGQKVEMDTRHYDGGLPEYNVPSKEIFTFNIASLVVRRRIEHDERMALASDSAQLGRERSN